MIRFFGIDLALILFATVVFDNRIATIGQLPHKTNFNLIHLKKYISHYNLYFFILQMFLLWLLKNET